MENQPYLAFARACDSPNRRFMHSVAPLVEAFTTADLPKQENPSHVQVFEPAPVAKPVPSAKVVNDLAEMKALASRASLLDRQLSWWTPCTSRTPGRPVGTVGFRAQSRSDKGPRSALGGASATAELKAEGIRDPTWAVMLARWFLDAGAEVIMVESEGITENVESWRTDVPALFINQLGPGRLMFEASDPEVFALYVKNYGPEVDLLIDPSQIVQLECLRPGIWGTKSLWGRVASYTSRRACNCRVAGHYLRCTGVPLAMLQIRRDHFILRRCLPDKPPRLSGGKYQSVAKASAPF